MRVTFPFSAVSLLCVHMLVSVPASAADETKRGASPVIQAVPGEVPIQGQYRALIIGINDYQGPPKLKTAVADATGIRDVLVERYGFKTENIKLLLNAEATRSRIEGALFRLARESGPHDSVMVYYAGHGQYSDDNQLAWWVPADGSLEEPGTWILDAAIRNYIAAMRAQHDRTHPGIHEWPYTIEVGERVRTILTSADREAASLVIVGLGAHGVTARIFRRETALRLIRAATVPVLAVPTYGWGVPHSALVALDFTRSSEDAARAALDLLGGEGTLYLAHVTPRVPIPQGDSRPWEEVVASGIVPRLESVARRLEPPPGVQVEYVTLHGEPANELLAFADQFKIDLIAAGAHGRSALGRVMLGSVSSKLVRSAQCWVLVAPPVREHAEEIRRIGSA